MRRASFSRAAVSDIDRIWDYTFETWGVDQAERYVLDLRKVCDELATGLKSVRPFDGRPGYLRYAIGRHVVFCRETDDGILVVRVLHQRMDAGRHLGE